MNKKQAGERHPLIKCNYHLGEGNMRKDRGRVVDERRYLP